MDQSRFQKKRLPRWLAPRSLRYQLLTRSLLILSGLLVLIGVLQYVLMSHFLFQSTAENIRTQIQALPVQTWANDGDATRHDDGFNNQQPLGLTIHDATVVFIDPSGNYRVVFQAPDAHPAPHLSNDTYQTAMKLGNRVEGQYQILQSDGQQALVVLVAVGSPNHSVGVVQVSTDTDSIHRVLTEQLLIFLFLGIGALVAGMLTFIPTLKRTLDPLSKMSQSVARVDAGNMEERILLNKPQSEIKLLADSFNAMLERLSLSFETERLAKERMRQFVADASHELRTPLTSIRGFVEVLLRGAASKPDQLHKSLESMRSESERLTKLVQDLLTLARLDEERPLDGKEESLDAMLHSMEPQLHILAGQREVGILSSEPVHLWFDKDRIKQVILNLFQNAVEHTDAARGKISLSAATAPDAGVYLTVRDNGVGISEEHVDQLFERFYRVDTARSRKHGGAGLGLAITKSIVERHGGTISCNSKVGEGTTFVIWLPQPPPEENAELC